MRLNTTIAALFFAMIGLGQDLSSNVQRGTVILHVKDSYGGEIQPRAITALTLTSESGRDFSPKGFLGSINNLPFGDYVLKIEVPGFSYWVGPLRIREQRTRVTVAMRVAWIEVPDPPCAISGMITDTDVREVWIRLMPLFTTESVEADVETDGTFHLEAGACGKYVLAVMKGQQILRTLVVDLVFRTKPVNISLADVK